MSGNRQVTDHICARICELRSAQPRSSLSNTCPSSPTTTLTVEMGHHGISHSPLTNWWKGTRPRRPTRTRGGP